MCSARSFGNLEYDPPALGGGGITPALGGFREGIAPPALGGGGITPALGGFREGITPPALGDLEDPACFVCNSIAFVC